MAGELGDVEEDLFESRKKVDDELDGQVENGSYAVRYSSDTCQSIVYGVPLASHPGRMGF
jgi:hypothetical protein